MALPHITSPQPEAQMSDRCLKLADIKSLSNIDNHSQKSDSFL